MVLHFPYLSSVLVMLPIEFVFPGGSRNWPRCLSYPRTFLQNLILFSIFLYIIRNVHLVRST